MSLQKLSQKNIKKQKGFTLIEMLVSVGIFAIVLTIILGTIVTIVDTSRKTRSMTEVMNNLNFVFESMTRTLKTAKEINDSDGTSISAISQDNERVCYLINRENNIGRLYKAKLTNLSDNCTNNVDDYIELTSDDVDITGFYLDKIDYEEQPRVFLSIKGRVTTAKGIFSEFSMQTTVSQRNLEL
jgi:prepilin-type N-terminal cleavage/methylation domain-containing protein